MVSATTRYYHCYHPPTYGGHLDPWMSEGLDGSQAVVHVHTQKAADQVLGEYGHTQKQEQESEETPLKLATAPYQERA